MGNGDWGLVTGKKAGGAGEAGEAGEEKIFTNAQCPMPNASLNITLTIFRKR